MNAPLLIALVAAVAGPPAAQEVRSPARAVPAGATFLLVLPQMRDIERAVDTVEQLLGPRTAEEFLAQAPLPALALQELLVDPPERAGLDPSGAVGLFRLPGFSGAVGFIAVRDPKRAMERVVETLTQGALASEKLADVVRLQFEDGQSDEIFTERGYLYLVMSDAEAEPPTHLDFVRVRAAIRRPGAVLADEPLYRELVRKVPPGELVLYLRPLWPETPSLRAALMSFHLDVDRLSAEGWLSSTEPLASAERSVPPLLRDCAANPTLALQISLRPSLLAGLLESALEPVPSPLRARVAGDLGSLLASLEGTEALTFHADPALILSDLFDGSAGPRPLGTITAEASLRDRATAERVLPRALTDLGWRFQSGPSPGATELTGEIQTQPVRIRLEDHRLELVAGPSLAQRGREDLLVSLQRRFGPGPFAPGHTSLFIDFAGLQKQLRGHVEIPGQSDEDVRGIQQYSRLAFADLARMSALVFDVAPEPGGGRLFLQVDWSEHPAEW